MPFGLPLILRKNVLMFVAVSEIPKRRGNRGYATNASI